MSVSYSGSCFALGSVLMAFRCSRTAAAKEDAAQSGEETTGLPGSGSELRRVLAELLKATLTTEIIGLSRILVFAGGFGNWDAHPANWVGTGCHSDRPSDDLVCQNARFTSPHFNMAAPKYGFFVALSVCNQLAFTIGQYSS